MKIVTTGMTSQLPIRSLAALFQLAAKESRGKASMLGKLAGGPGIVFFKPEEDGVFGGLDEDAEDFCVGVHIPRLTGGRNDPVRTVQMQVWDRGNVREVLLLTGRGVTGVGGAQRVLRSFTNTFQRNDSSCSVVSDDAEWQASPTDGSTPAGWYPDPEGISEYRYWDGTAWTEHRA